jgi:Flp pilus assembly protein TadG
MLSKILRKLRELRSHTSGNALMIVAVGMPALIGGAGLAVDVSQWYMWKREMQYAVDQAALAGAWARANTNSAVQSTYQTRATQEYTSNISMVNDFDVTPSVALANYGSGTNNSVLVTVSATKELPFTSFVTGGQSTTVFVKAQATFVEEVASTTTDTILPARTACMVALNGTASGAFTIGGTAGGMVTCGGAALSNHATAAIDENGNPDAKFSSLAATGGIATSLNDNIISGGSSKIFANQTGMTNPFSGITAPVGPTTVRTMPTCAVASAGTTTGYTVDGKRVNTPTYRYFSGASSATATEITYTSGTGYLANPAETDVSGGAFTGRTLGASPVPTTGNQTSTAGGWTAVETTYTEIVAPTYKPNGSLKTDGIWRRQYTRQIDKYSVVTPITSGGSDGITQIYAGTWSSLSFACAKTNMNPGVYTITGSLDFSQNKIVTGTDVLIKMSTANNISNINSNENLSLTGISYATLVASGNTAANATKLAGMLFWDPLSTSEIKFNGNSTTKFNGIFYTPLRHLWFNGTSAVSGYCMMLVADRLTLNGTTELSSFCQPSASSSSLTVRPETPVTTGTAGVAASVKLVV